jgi:hypothetical protein
VQVPSEVVTVVAPLPLPVVVTALLVLPFPECTVTPLPPVELAVTFPPPAVTVLESVPDGGFSPDFNFTTLQLPELDPETLVLFSAASANPLIATTAAAPINLAKSDDMACPFMTEWTRLPPKRESCDAVRLTPDAYLVFVVIAVTTLVTARVFAAFLAVLAGGLIGAIKSGRTCARAARADRRRRPGLTTRGRAAGAERRR